MARKQPNRRAVVGMTGTLCSVAFGSDCQACLRSLNFFS